MLQIYSILNSRTCHRALQDARWILSWLAHAVFFVKYCSCNNIVARFLSSHSKKCWGVKPNLTSEHGFIIIIITNLEGAVPEEVSLEGFLKGFSGFSFRGAKVALIFRTFWLLGSLYLSTRLLLRSLLHLTLSNTFPITSILPSRSLLIDRFCAYVGCLPAVSF